MTEKIEKEMMPMRDDQNALALSHSQAGLTRRSVQHKSIGWIPALGAGAWSDGSCQLGRSQRAAGPRGAGGWPATSPTAARRPGLTGNCLCRY
jgi:1-acyl-sn-glycerol-3-phosphate acyltransferase